MVNQPIARINEGALPQNIEAEQAVLGSLLIDRRAVERIASFLRPDDFYLPVNAEIYRGMIALFERDMPTDIVTLSDHLHARDRLDDMGGAAYLASLATIVPTSINVEYYARIVERLAVLRRLIDAGNRIATLGYDESQEAETALEEAERVLFEVSRLRVTRDFQHMSQVLAAVYEKIDHIHSRDSEITGITTGYIDLDRLTSGLQRSDLVILAARPSMGKCLTGHMVIDDPLTGERLTIEQFYRERRPYVLGISDRGDVRPARVTNWIDSGVKPCLRVTTSTGRRVEVTGHHPFLTATGWRPLYDLRPGDTIAVPRVLPCFGSESPEPELVRVMAYCIADGGLTGTTRGFAGTDPDIVADDKAARTHRFSAWSVGQERTTSEVRPENCCSRHGNSMRDGENRPSVWLRSHGLMGQGMEHRGFPSCVWRWSRASLAEFLRALLSCGGSMFPHGAQTVIELSVASHDLAADVHHALTRFGIVARLRKKTDQCWSICISDPFALALYQERIGWLGEPSGACAAQTLHTGRDTSGVPLRAYATALHGRELEHIANPDLYWDEIESIEPIGEHQVFDLTVTDGANFIAQDICVHNTALALNIAHSVAVKENLPVGIFSIEMSAEQLAHRLISLQAQIDSQKLRSGRMSDADWDRLVQAVGVLSEAPIYVDDTPGLSTVEMRSKARRLHSEQGLGLLVVDYLQLMQGATNESRVQEIGAISRSLKAVARELDVPVLALSQLSRAPEQRPNHEPMLSDLRESGCLVPDTRVRRADTGAEVTLGELYASGATNIPVWSLDSFWHIRPAVMTHVFSSGTKMVYRLTLASGRQVEASANHPFRMVHGWTALEDLYPGCRIAVLDAAGRQRMSCRERVAAIAGVGVSLERQAAAGADIAWDTVASIEPIGKQEVFDATVLETHNFVANDIIAHNSIEQDADLVMFIYRDVQYNPETERPHVADVIVAKHRNGPTGKIHLFFQESLMKFLDLSVRDDE